MNALLANPGHENHWMGLKLTGTKSNRSAIGTRVRLDFDDTDGPRSIYRTVNSGTSFGDTPFELHLGLGQARTVKAVHIDWPSGKKQRLTDLKIDTIYDFREGDARPTVRAVKPFSFPTTGTHIHHAG